MSKALTGNFGRRAWQKCTLNAPTLIYTNHILMTKIMCYSNMYLIFQQSHLSVQTVSFFLASHAPSNFCSCIENNTNKRCFVYVKSEKYEPLVTLKMAKYVYSRYILLIEKQFLLFWIEKKYIWIRIITFSILDLLESGLNPKLYPI